MQLICLRLAQRVQALTGLAYGRTGQGLDAILTICTMIQSHMELFCIGQHEMIIQGEILCFRRQIADRHRNVICRHIGIQHTGITGCMLLQPQQALVLIDQIPAAVSGRCKGSCSKATGNIIDILRCLKAVSAIPIHHHRLTVYIQLAVIVTRISGYG